MNLHVTGHQIAVTPAIREYVAGKLQRITHHFDQVIDVNVIVSAHKLEHKAEATVHVRGKDIFCESSADDLYAAIDGLTDKLDRALLKHKNKGIAHRHDAPPVKHHVSEE